MRSDFAQNAINMKSETIINGGIEKNLKSF